MPSSSNTREPRRIEPKADIANGGALNAADSLRLHWPEYLMEAGESGAYLFCACAFATLLWHPASPLQPYLPNDAIRRMLMVALVAPRAGFVLICAVLVLHLRPEARGFTNGFSR